ncbi:MAG: paraquat-inducible protein A [Rhodobacter sp.]|nr:paraquat-inducible protein A [Rhodobacter sp.]
MPYLRLANLSLLVLFPLAWFAPLLHAGLNLPLFGLKKVSVISGLQALWESDVILALLVTALALLAPYLKTIGLALVHFRLASPRILTALHILGKLAMADVFLIALYIVVVKGVGMARVETGWGLYFFTGCILASIAISILTERLKRRPTPPPAQGGAPSGAP